MADRFQEPLFSNELDDTEVVYHSFGGEVRKSDSRVHDHPIPVSGIISCTGFVAPCGQRQAFYTLSLLGADMLTVFVKSDSL